MTHTAIGAAPPGRAGQATLADRMGGILNRPPLHGAACARRTREGQLVHDPDIFFPNSGEGYGKAKAVCAHCPARDECLEWILSVEGDTPSSWNRSGFYGGLTPDERAALSKGAA